MSLPETFCELIKIGFKVAIIDLDGHGCYHIEILINSALDAETLLELMALKS